MDANLINHKNGGKEERYTMTREKFSTDMTGRVSGAREFAPEAIQVLTDGMSPCLGEGRKR